MKPGKLIQLLRNAEGISQSELASRLEISRSYLSQVENGHNEPGMALLEKVAKYFDIPLAFLVIDKHRPDAEISKELQKLFAEVLSMKLLIDESVKV